MKKRFLLMMLVSVYSLHLQGVDRGDEPAAKRVRIVSPADDAAAYEKLVQDCDSALRLVAQGNQNGAAQNAIFEALFAKHGLAMPAAPIAFLAMPAAPIAAAAAANDGAMNVDSQGLDEAVSFDKYKRELIASEDRNNLQVYCFSAEIWPVISKDKKYCRSDKISLAKDQRVLGAQCSQCRQWIFMRSSKDPKQEDVSNLMVSQEKAIIYAMTSKLKDHTSERSCVKI